MEPKFKPGYIIKDTGNQVIFRVGASNDYVEAHRVQPCYLLDKLYVDEYSTRWLAYEHEKHFELVNFIKEIYDIEMVPF